MLITAFVILCKRNYLFGLTCFTVLVISPQQQHEKAQADLLKMESQMKIVIQTNADFTPKGKRNARVVTLRGAFGPVQRIRWYVSGRIYRALQITDENLKLTNEWLSA